jgi:hypothetical protein
MINGSQAMIQPKWSTPMTTNSITSSSPISNFFIVYDKNKIGKREILSHLTFIHYLKSSSWIVFSFITSISMNATDFLIFSRILNTLLGIWYLIPDISIITQQRDAPTILLSIVLISNFIVIFELRLTLITY